MTRQTVKSTEITKKIVGLRLGCHHGGLSTNSTLANVSMQHWPYPKLTGQQVAIVAPWYKSVTYVGLVST